MYVCYQLYGFSTEIVTFTQMFDEQLKSARSLSIANHDDTQINSTVISVKYDSFCVYIKPIQNYRAEKAII